jgi:hypothetical protein
MPITDPRHLDVDIQSLLDPQALQQLADNIDDRQAAPGAGKGPGDTVWMGVMDSSGLAVSFIQSLYHEFGSGVVLPDSGIVWQNRGASFSLDPAHLLALAPGKQPFHTLNPPPRASTTAGSWYTVQWAGMANRKLRRPFSPATSCRASRCRRVFRARAGCWAEPGDKPQTH